MSHSERIWRLRFQKQVMFQWRSCFRPLHSYVRNWNDLCRLAIFTVKVSWNSRVWALKSTTYHATGKASFLPAPQCSDKQCKQRTLIPEPAHTCPSLSLSLGSCSFFFHPCFCASSLSFCSSSPSAASPRFHLPLSPFSSALSSSPLYYPCFSPWWNIHFI